MHPLRLLQLTRVLHRPDAPPGAPPPPAPADPAPTAPPAPTPGQTPPSPAPLTPTGQAITTEAWQALQAEAADFRKKSKASDDLLAGFKALLSPDGTTTPDAIKSQLDAVKAENRALRVNSAVTEVSAELGYKPRLTRALLNDSDALNGLDPESPTFKASLTLAMKRLEVESPEIKAGLTPAPPAAPHVAGVPLNGSAVPPPLTLEEAANMSAAEIEKNWAVIEPLMKAT